MINKTVRTILKVALSAGAIYYVATNLDFRLIHEAIRSSNVVFLVVALLFYVASQVAAAYRLNRLFRQVPLHISQLENFKLYWLGLFYNLFLPGGVGGDGFKVYLLGKYLKAPIKKIIGVILSDRVSGLSVILMFLLLLFPYIDYDFPLQRWAWILIPFVLLGYYLFLRFFNRSLIPAIIPVTGWALSTQLLQMGAAIMILQSLGVKLDGIYQNYLFLFFLSAIMGAIPITLGGIGAREITFLFGANYLGINETYAVSLSILFYAASAITAFPGIIYTIKPADILKDK